MKKSVEKKKQKRGEEKRSGSPVHPEAVSVLEHRSGNVHVADEDDQSAEDVVGRDARGSGGDLGVPEMDREEDYVEDDEAGGEVGKDGGGGDGEGEDAVVSPVEGEEEGESHGE